MPHPKINTWYEWGAGKAAINPAGKEHAASQKNWLASWWTVAYITLLLTVWQVAHPTKVTWSGNPAQRLQCPNCTATPPCNHILVLLHGFWVSLSHVSHLFACTLPGELEFITDEALNKLQLREQVPSDEWLHTSDLIATWYIPLQLHAVGVPWLAPVLPTQQAFGHDWHDDN